MKEEKLVAHGDLKRDSGEEKYRFNKVNLQYNFFAPFKCKMTLWTMLFLMKRLVSFSSLRVCTVDALCVMI